MMPDTIRRAARRAFFAAVIASVGCAHGPVCGCLRPAEPIRRQHGHDWKSWVRDEPVRNPRGRVVDAAGAPVEGALVEVLAVEVPRRLDSPALAACLTDSRGCFSFPGLNDGEYEIRCTQASHNTTSIVVTVSGKWRRNEEIEIPLWPGT